MNVENPLCPHCGSGPLYAKQGIPSAGLLGPNLLPGLDFLAADFDLIACQNCGFVQFFIAKSFRKGLAKSWKCISRKADQPSTHGQTMNTQSSSGSFADTGLTNFLNEISLAESQPVQRKKKNPAGPAFWKENKKNLLIGGGVLGGLILLAGIVISLRTKDGTLVLKVSEPDANVQVLNEVGKVEITRKGEKSPLTISLVPGKHQLKVQKDGFELFTDNFEIKSEGKASITAKLVPVEDTPTVVEANKPLAFETPAFKKWMKGVAVLPAEEQVAAVTKKLQELNPGFDGKVTHQRIEDGVVTELHFYSDNVTDISPVRALAGLKILLCNGTNEIAPDQRHLSDLSPLKGLPLILLGCNSTLVSDLSPLKAVALTVLKCDFTMVSDLSPLRAMSLTHLSINGTPVSDLLPLQGKRLLELDCSNTKVTDLSPLKGMPLSFLQIQGTQVSDLSPLIGMKLGTLYCYESKVFDLSPLKGMPLGALSCSSTPVTDLSPLQGMKLKALGCYNTKISDLSPLNGMPLTHFYCFGTKVSDLSPLEGMNLTLFLVTPKDIKVGIDAIRQMKSLQTIGIGVGSQDQFPPEEFWKKYDVGDFGRPTAPDKPITDFNSLAFQQWVKDVQAMPAEKQVEAVSKKLMELNPGFDGKLTNNFGVGSPVITNGIVTMMSFTTDNVTDVSPVRALVGLDFLSCRGSSLERGKLRDLSPLKGMTMTHFDCSYNPRLSDLSPLKGVPLTRLIFTGTQVTNLSMLQGMALEDLWIGNTDVSDLSPLKGMPLKQLMMWATKVEDLSPLKGMELHGLNMAGTPVKELSPLRGMPLAHLTCNHTPISDLSPLKGMPLTALNVSGSNVSDLSPLEGLNLNAFYFTPKAISKGADVLRQMKSLKTISNGIDEPIPAEEFWKKYDAGEFALPQ